MFKCINSLIVFFVITMNAYSQKVDRSERCFYCTGESVIYTDSTIVNGATVYTDSLIVDISVVYTDSTVIDGSIIYTDSNITYSPRNYHITLTNNPPFKSAIYRNNCEYFELIQSCTFMLWMPIPDEKRGYFIFSSDKKFVNYAFIKDIDGELYAKYNPMKKENNGSITFSMRNSNKLTDWIQKEMDKGRIVSMGCKNKRKYICKSFWINPDVTIDTNEGSDSMCLKLIKVTSHFSQDFNETLAWAHEQMAKGYTVVINYNKRTKEYIAKRREN